LFKWIFSLFIFLNFFTISLNALEISLQGAKENFQNYSTLHIKDKNKFLCQEIKNDFDVTTKIVCAFSKSPQKKIKTIQNDFFKIETQIKKRTFFLIITPFIKLKLYPVVFNLSEEESIYESDVKLSQHWMIIGYKKELPYIKKEQNNDISINFPFHLDRNKLPFVGSLDIKGNPVHIQEVGDVSDYLNIKRYYKEEKYEKCLDLIEDVMSEYPNSLFGAELLYYKIRVSNKLDNHDDVIVYSKVYLREYSSDENVAEVLALSARSYALNGMRSEADYFFDRLFDEHGDSPYAKWGYIYRGEMLEDSGGVSKALIYYEKALHNTKNIEIAVTAAYKLARYKINNAKRKEASKYIMKIIKAKPSFFISKYKTTLKMMEIFADEEEYISAAAIAQALIDEMSREYDEYEILLKNIGLWLSKTDQKKGALNALNNYLHKFPDGTFDVEVRTAKDSLFFDLNDANVSVKLENYNNLIDVYSGDSIAQRAIYEKAKLMLKNKMYGDVLEFKDAILDIDSTKYPDKQNIVNESALGVMEIALKNRECYSVLKIASEYSIILSDDWDDGIYECAMKGADFLLAKNISSKNLKSKDLEMRKKWLYRYIKVDFATGSYSDVVKASEDLISLIEEEVNSKYKDVFRIMFDTYQRLENANKMIESILKIEKVFEVSYQDIERYIAVMSIGSDTKDDNLVLKYANKVMKIQNSSSSYTQSPFVEFTSYQSYINKEDYSMALKVIKSLDDIDIDKEDRARQKYLLGTVYEKLWRDNEAQRAYQDAIDADATSAWAKLALGAKEN